MRLAYLVVLCSFLLVTPARALPSDGGGNYTQILCADPSSGEGLGITGMPEGLTNPASTILWQITTSQVNCASGAMSSGRGVPMSVGFSTTYAQGTWAALLYQAPTNVTINAGNIYRAEKAEGANSGFMGIIQQGGDYSSLYALPRNCCDQGDWFVGNVASRGTFATPFSPSNLVELTISPDGGHWDVNATCDPNGNNNSSCTLSSGQWEYRIFGGAISLHAANDPQASNITGGILTDTPLRANESVTFSATDQGPGLAYVDLLVDGTPVQSSTIDTNSGRCSPVPGHDPYTWAYEVPCKTSVGGRTYELNTALVHDGTHHVQVLIEDAAGNKSIVADRTVQTNNAPSILTSPAISGTAAPGSLLTGTAATFSAPTGAGSVSGVSSQWLRCTSSAIPSSCEPISGATGTTYTPTGEDAHHTIVYENAASDNDGQTAAYSGPTTEITGAEGSSTSTQTLTTTVLSSSSSTNESLSNEALAIARGAANGSPASDQARLDVHWISSASASSVRTTYTRRSRAQGRLVASDGQPIAGALLTVVATPASPGYQSFVEGTVRTVGDGTFVFDTQARRPSRTLTFEYKSHVNDLSLAAQAQLSVGVPAPISLRVRPRTVRRGSVIRMSGSVPTPIPTAGKQIVLQALAVGVRGAGWQTFNVVRTNRKGQFRGKYRFRFPGPARYRIRALTRYEQDYPYLASTSKSTLVYEH
jgi:hypothetical protein